MLNQLTRLFFPSAERQRAHVLYVALVEQSRNPFFYASSGVPDTLDGRFELILLHMFLVLHRLKAAHGGVFDEKESGCEQRLIEVFVEDMDRSLREIGVGDLGVGRRVKTMANAFYGRLQSYEHALGESEAALHEALRRNLYGTTQATDEAIHAMAGYVREAVAKLAAQDVTQLQDGVITFTDPGR
jgi:cytochrome b pre-mRNA-processing protein 3